MANRIGLVFDGKTSYINLPQTVSAGKSVWSISAVLSTTQNTSSTYVYHQPCLVGYDTPGPLSQDFHVDTCAGNLYLFNGMGNGTNTTTFSNVGTIKNQNGDYGYNTGISINDGKRHDIYLTSDGTKFCLYCDNVKLIESTITKTLSTTKPLYIGCSQTGEKVYSQLILYDFKFFDACLSDYEIENSAITENPILEYKPDSDDFTNKYLTDKTGNGYNSNTFVGTFSSVDVVDVLESTSGNTDIFRTVINTSLEVSGNADIFGNITASMSGNADTMRDVYLVTHSSGNADILRDVHFGVRGSGNADIRRTIKTSYSGNADMRYDARREQSENTDIMRNIAVRASGNADMSYLRRLLGVGNDDMIRIVKAISSGNADTRRIIPLIISDLTKAGIQSISITLAERTLSDTFQINTVNPLNVKDSIKGKLLDYSYSMSVESTSQQNMIQTVQGMYDVDELLYTPFHYFQPTENTAVEHARKIASAMGKSLSISIDDFIPSNNYAGTGATYQNIISGIFGWTSRLPRRQINVFIRNNVLNVIQRGHESSVVDISSYSHSQPQIERKIVRSVWSGDNGNHSAKNGETRPTPFTGTIGDSYCYNTYINGLIRESVQGNESTTYNYFLDYLETKIVSRSDGSSTVTSYSYAPTGTDMYISTEIETTTDKKGKSSTRITRHHAVGHGWYTTSTDVDGVFQGSSLSQGKPGGKASQYSIDQNNISMGSRWPDDDTKINGGTALIDTDFPVTGKDMLKKLTAEIEWMNQRIEETVSVDITPAVIAGTCSLQHIIDFTDRIKLDGNEYYLVSNAVIQDPRSIKQKLKLVRWY